MKKIPQRPRENRPNPLPTFSPSIPSKRAISDDFPLPASKCGFSSTSFTRMHAPQSLSNSNFVVDSLPLSVQHHSNGVQGLNLVKVYENTCSLYGDISRIVTLTPLAKSPINRLGELGIKLIDYPTR